MKGYIAKVRFSEAKSVASHIVEVDEEAVGRTRFHFKRICHNAEENKDFPIQPMKLATFAQQLRSINRAYAVTCATEEQYHEFIDIMLKDAYGADASISIEEVKE